MFRCVVRLTPSPQCTFHVHAVPARGPNAAHFAPQGGTVQLQRAAPTATPPQPPGGTAGFAQTREEAGSGAVKVTLQDCLACSGCVTSAETVLLEHQSVAELRTRLRVSGCLAGYVSRRTYVLFKSSCLLHCIGEPSCLRRIRAPDKDIIPLSCSSCLGRHSQLDWLCTQGAGYWHWSSGADTEMRCVCVESIC